MPRIVKIILFTMVLLLLLGGGLYVYYRWRLAGKEAFSGPTSSPLTQSEDAQKDDTNVEIKGGNVLVGKFVRGEEGKIVFEQNGENKELPTSSGFAFVCTDQIINDEAVLEYGKVTGVYPMAPAEVKKRIEAGEPILVMTNPDQDGSIVANSIVSSRCGVSF